jgi:hypothetical protein
MSGSYAVRRVHEEHPNLKPELIRQRLAYSTFVNLERRYMYYSPVGNIGDGWRLEE